MPNGDNSSATNGVEGNEDALNASGQPTAGGPAPSSGETGFRPDELIGGRFRIHRYIARGGMGEVYEAFDLELNESVALKTVRPEMTVNARSMERFRREVQLARRVTHPSVCRIFDVFHHRASGSDVTFLSMELLKGQTLSERLRCNGPMTTAEAWPVVKQMAEALSAAHQAEVIHRDFKSSNVVLIPKNTDVRVVVTDFGLARALESDDVSLSASGDIVGTPAYMAPEQITGDEITPATDIYALGVVLYEMVTGRLPFEGDSPLSVAMKRLKETPLPPRSYVQNLDPKWEFVILRCLQRKPEERFSTAADVAKSLSGETRALPVKRRSRTILATIIILLGIVVYQLALGRKTKHSLVQTRAVVTAPNVDVRTAVAVLGFKNLSGKPESAWLSTALSETISSELAINEKIRTISGENVARLKNDLALPEANSLARDTLDLIRKRSGTKYVVLGSFLAMDGKIRLDLLMQDAESGEMATPRIRNRSAIAGSGLAHRRKIT